MGAVARTDRRGEVAPANTREKREALKAELSRYAPSFEKVLPKAMTPERLTTLALVAATKTPAILNCTPESIALSMVRIAQWGLDIGTTAHLVPFKGQCTAIADWKGLVQLLLRSGHVRDVWARAVYQGDQFSYRYGLHPDLEHRPIGRDPRERPDASTVTHAYAVAVLRRGETFEVMTRAEIDAIRDGARRGDKDSEAWVKHYPEMAKKTAIRRLAKRLPQTEILADALTAGEDEDEGAARLRAFFDTSPRPRVRKVAEIDPANEIKLASVADKTVHTAGAYDNDEPEPVAPAPVTAQETSPYAEPAHSEEGRVCRDCGGHDGQHDPDCQFYCD